MTDTGGNVRKNERFVRKTGTRNQKVRYVIACEGAETEKCYFNRVNDLCKRLGRDDIIVELVPKAGKPHRSSPEQVLKLMKKHLAIHLLECGDEAFVVIDRDTHAKKKLDMIAKWAKSNKAYNLVLSNPCFELWLLLHFEDKPSNPTADIIRSCLKKHLPKYKIRIDAGKIGVREIKQAIGRARQLDNPPCADWPRHCGSTLYRLLEKIFP